MHFPLRAACSGRAPEHLGEILANFESGPSGRLPRRCLTDPSPHVCWGLDASGPPGDPVPGVESLDCDSESNPMQIHYDGVIYELGVLDWASGAYETVFSLSWWDGDVSAAAVLDGGDDGKFALAAFGDELCRFDQDGKICLNETLGVEPDVGAVVGTSYYYAKSPGSSDDVSFYWVEYAHSDLAVVHASDPRMAVSASLFSGAVLDAAGLEEGTSSTVFVDDGVAASYLIGLGPALEVLVVRIANDGAPADYAVLQGASDDYDGSDAFRAAFSYASRDGEAARVFFAAASGELFELDLPLVVADDCWNGGVVATDHALCDASTPALATVLTADATIYADGLNCPVHAGVAWTGELLFATAAPTLEPTETPSASPSNAPTDAPTNEPCASALCWGDQATGLVDCSLLGGAPFVAAAPWDASLQSYGEIRINALDYGEGTWSDAGFLLNDQSVGAVSVFVTEIGDYVLGAVGSKLCRLGDTSTSCFAESLVVAPDAGAARGASFYYAYDLGGSSDEIYYVDAVLSPRG